jgi:glycosyltransferase involved in cell wall biosynthesis
MKILFAKSSFAGPISGADEIVANYAIEMKKAGHLTNILLVHSPEPGNPQITYLNNNQIPVSILASSAFSTSLAIGRKAALELVRAISPASRTIRSVSRKIVFNLLQRYHNKCCEYLLFYRPDVVHVITPDPGAVMLIRAAHTVGIPVVYQEVGIPYHPPGFEEVYERLVSVLPLCTEVAALSPRLAREMEKIVSQLNRVRVLPLISQSAPKNTVEQKLPSEDVCFGFAARLEALKGPLTFVNAFAQANCQYPHANIKIAGSGSEYGAIVARIKELNLANKSELLGVYKTVQERTEFMQSIDVFVLPSLTEGTPNAIIEAMSYGKPVIATAVGGIPDIVTEEVGMLVPAGGTEKLGLAMAKMAADSDLRRKMGLAAREKYERLFTAPAVLPVITEFYEKVIKEARPGKSRQPTESKHSNHPWIS